MRDMLNGSPCKAIGLFALPLYLSNLLQQAYILADSIIVGKYVGPNGLAAIGASFPILFLIAALFIGVMFGFSIRIANLKGAGDRQGIVEAMGSLLVFAALASVVASLLSTRFAADMLRLVGLPPELLPDGLVFMRTLSLGFLPVFGFNALSAVMRGLGDSKTPFLITVISSIANIVLVYVLVAVLGWGVRGAALATVLAQAIALFAGLGYVIVKFRLRLGDVRQLRVGRAGFIGSVRLGAPLAMQQFIIAGGVIALVAVISPFGATMLAVFTIMGRLELFASMPFLDLSGAMTTFTAQNLGAGRYARVHEGTRQTLVLVLGLTAVMSMVLFVFADAIMAIFVADPQIIEVGGHYTRVVYPALFMFSVMAVLHGTLNGLGKTALPLICTVLSFWVVRIPLSWWFGRHDSFEGVIWCVVIGWAVGFAYTLVVSARALRQVSPPQRGSLDAGRREESAAVT